MLLHVCDAGARAVERRGGGGGGALIGETIVVGVEVGQGQPLEATLTKLADMSRGFVHSVRVLGHVFGEARCRAAAGMRDADCWHMGL